MAPGTPVNSGSNTTARAVLLPVDDGRLWTRVMPENEGLERVARIEKKLDALSTSVDERFKDVDKRFDEVRDRFVEQREYVEFAYDQLNRRISGGFAGLDQRVTDVKQELTGGLARVERRLDRLIDSQTSPSAPPSRRVRPSKRRR